MPVLLAKSTYLHTLNYLFENSNLQNKVDNTSKSSYKMNDANKRWLKKQYLNIPLLEGRIYFMLLTGSS
jgi:hypothetical protein